MERRNGNGGNDAPDTPAPLRDAVELSALRRGDVDAFQALYLSRYHRLWEFAYGLVRVESAAEDIVHDVFAALWHRRETLQIQESIDAYLYGAIRHRALNLLRHGRLSAHETIVRDAAYGVVPAFGTVAEETDAVVEAADLQARVEAAVSRLSEGQQQVLLLHWRHGLSNAEIGQIMAMTNSAVAAQLSRAREALRRQLGME